MSDKQKEKIQPVDFDISESPIFSAQAGNEDAKKSPVLVWASLGVLVLLALAVIFVLPGIVSRYELPLEARVTPLENPAVTRPTAQNPQNAVSPFDEAQRSRLRKEAQDRLAELLAAQATLTEGQVELWGSETYDRALELAHQGDDSYLQQNFAEARDAYQAGAERLTGLIDSIPQVIDNYLAQGQAALADNDSVAALDSFAVALALEPDNPVASTGHRRAETLDQVNDLVDQANQALEAQELQQARDLFRQAVALDRQHSGAQRGLVTADQRIVEERFAQTMSAGFALLQEGEPQQAIETFQRAAALGIHTDQAQAAITQTENEVARLAIERYREAALAAENNEQWQDAVQAYDEALAVDSNLVFAQTGRDYADKRSRLDQLLEGAIANPERLSEPAVYEQTLDVFYTGRAIQPAGPRLSRQLDELQKALDYSQVPIDVQLVSDNLTQVSLLRVAELGSFEAHSLSLKPGRYVAVGTRSGFRDVRQEFVVGFGKTPETVVVQCDEQVVRSRGR